MFGFKKTIEDYNDRKNRENEARIPIRRDLVELKRLRGWMTSKFNIYNPKQINFLYRKIHEFKFEDMPEVPVEMFYYNVEGAECKIALDLEYAQNEFYFFHRADPTMELFKEYITTDNFANYYFQAIAWAWKNFDPIFEFLNRKIEELEKQIV